MKLLSRLKQAYSLFLQYRKQGRSITNCCLILCFKATNLLWRKYSVDQECIRVFDDDLDATEGNDVFDVSKEKILSLGEIERIISLKKKIFVWFIPHCTNIWGGGHYTLFRFINYFTTNHDVQSFIFIYDYNEGHKDLLELQYELNQAFLSESFVLVAHYNQLPAHYVAIATTWQSAYYVKNSFAKQKFYFMQDYESLFYPAGTLALQANYTYSFGFHGITGGYWLEKIFKSYGSNAQAYVFSADRDLFYPCDKKGIVRDRVKRIFFYGRPSTPRRAYELGIKALRLIKKAFPFIEIVIAGLSGIAKPKFECVLLGNLSLRATGDLYRTCDIGIALSATNMSYLPVELMATGCPVVSNKGEQVEWYCKDNYNALLTDPTPSSIFEAVKSLIESKELRQKLVSNGLATVEKTTWNDEMEKIYQYINSKCD